jgi:hypothetical protein
VIESCRDCGIPVIGAKRCNRCAIEHVHRMVWGARWSEAMRTAFEIIVILQALIAVTAYLLLVLTGSC